MVAMKGGGPGVSAGTSSKIQYVNIASSFSHHFQFIFASSYPRYMAGLSGDGCSRNDAVCSRRFRLLPRQFWQGTTKPALCHRPGRQDGSNSHRSTCVGGPDDPGPSCLSFLKPPRLHMRLLHQRPHQRRQQLRPDWISDDSLRRDFACNADTPMFPGVIRRDRMWHKRCSSTPVLTGILTP